MALAAGSAPPATAARRTAVRTPDRARATRYWARDVERLRAGTARWLTVIRGRPPQVAASRSLAARRLAAHSPLSLRRLARSWRRREHRAWRQANHPPDLAAWSCIHSYEGSWTDRGAPYWGGLQMDLSFQETYGGWLLRHRGTADHWSPLEQIWTAVRAARSRGFLPWANTARLCGLI